MLKILLPVDFSQSTDVATHYALKLAAAVPNTHLLLLHCFQDYLSDDLPVQPEAGLSSSELITQQVLHRNQVEAQQTLEEHYTMLLHQLETVGQNTKLDRKFVYGMPEEVIPAQIAHFKPDLVVMGTHGETSLLRSLFGTIPTHLLDEIKVPLLTVPLHYEATALQNVLYATDFDKQDTEALHTLQELMQPFGANIYCLHISDGSTSTDTEKLSELKKQLQQNSSLPNIEFILLEGDDVAAALQEFVTQNNINLLALTTHERTLLDGILHPSLAKKLVLESKVPLLVFHGSRKEF